MDGRHWSHGGSFSRSCRNCSVIRWVTEKVKCLCVGGGLPAHGWDLQTSTVSSDADFSVVDFIQEAFLHGFLGGDALLGLCYVPLISDSVSEGETEFTQAIPAVADGGLHELGFAPPAPLTASEGDVVSMGCAHPTLSGWAKTICVCCNSPRQILSQHVVWRLFCRHLCFFSSPLRHLVLNPSSLATIRRLGPATRRVLR